MTANKVIEVLSLNIKTARILLKSKALRPEAKAKIEGIVKGYKFAIELLKSK